MSIDANRDDEVSTVRYWSAGTTGTPHYHAGVAVACTCSTPDDLESSTDAVEPEVEEIRSEIEHTRTEMSHTIDAIQDRLNPRRLVHEAQDTVREATVGKAERMMSDAGDAATEMVSSAGDTARGFGTSLVDAVRRNPVAALVTGVGLGWLFMSARKDDDRYDYDREGRSRMAGRAAYYPPYGARPMGTRYSGYGRGYAGTGYAPGYGRGYGGYEYDDDRDGGLTNRVGSVASDVQDRVGSAASDVQDRAGEMVSKASDKLSDTASRVADRVSDTTDQVQDRASYLADQVRGNVDDWTDMAQERFYDARSQYERVMDETPLAVGAVALAVGVAVGMALPGTPHEDRMLGPARDRLMDQAQEVAHDTAQKVQRVVDEVQTTAKEEAQKQGLMGQADASSSSQGTTSSQQPAHAQSVRG
jgi:hypothetical protein